MYNKYADKTFIGDAPRYIIHAACIEAIDIPLGRFVGARKCHHCRKPMREGLVVSAPAKLPHRMRKRNRANDSPEGPAAA